MYTVNFTIEVCFLSYTTITMVVPFSLFTVLYLFKENSCKQKKKETKTR